MMPGLHGVNMISSNGWRKKIFFLKKQSKSISDWQTRDKDGEKITLNWMTLVSKTEERQMAECRMWSEVAGKQALTKMIPRCSSQEREAHDIGDGCEERVNVRGKARLI